jgi:hypothetical protein
MNITLEQAEQLVDRNKTLRWDGWTIVQSVLSPIGWLKPNGEMRNGKWYLTTRWDLNPDGTYTIPKALGHGL